MSLYNRALTQSQIQAIVAAVPGGKCTLAAPPFPCVDLARVQVVVGQQTNEFAGSTDWRFDNLSFVARQSATTISFT